MILIINIEVCEVFGQWHDLWGKLYCICIFFTFSGSKVSTKSIKSKPSVTKESKPSQKPNQRDTSFPKVSSPRTMMEATSFNDFYGTKDTERKEDISLSLSARSDLSFMSDKTLTNQSSQSSPRSIGSTSSPRLQGSRLLPRSQELGSSPVSARSGSSQGSSRKPKDRQPVERRTTVDLLVDEIMGEGKILSGFNSGKSLLTL